nr:oligosaccharide flippase family protein [Methanobacterium formicicum]
MEIDSFKFGKDILWISIFQIFYAFSGLITLPVLTKNYGAELYGLWAIILATVGLFTPILTLHLGTALIRYFSNDHDKNSISQAFSNILFTIIIIMVSVLILAIYYKYSISNFIFDSSIYSNYVPITFLWAGSTAIFSYLISYLRSQEKVKEISIIQLLWSFFKILMIIFISILDFSFYSLILSQIVVDILFSILVLLYIKKEIKIIIPNFKKMKQYLKFSIPQIPTGILLWLINSIDRYFISFFLGLTETGIYSASYSLGSMISLFYAPISFVIFPVISKFWEQNDKNNVKKYLENSLNMFLFLSIPASVGLFVLSKQVLNLLTTAEFIADSSLILMICLGTIFLGIYEINFYIILLDEKNSMDAIYYSFKCSD